MRVAVLAGGRSSEHEISVASARSVVAALDPDRYETSSSRSTEAGRWELGVRRAQRARPRPSVETLPVVADSRAGGRARPGRRRAADPARPVRRGRHGAGPPRARRRPLRRRRRRRLGAVHGQGPLQGGAPRPRDPRRAQRHAARRRRARAPLRLPGVREAGPARLVGRDLEGARAPTSSAPPSSSRAGTTTRC